MKITCTNGNRKNGISGSRITVAVGEKIVDRFAVPKRNGVKYCYKYQNGQYGKRLQNAINKANHLDSITDPRG